MKKLIAIFLTLCLCASLFACGSNPAQEAPEQAANAPTTAPTEPEETSAPTEPPIVYTPVTQGEVVPTASGSEFIIAETDWSYDLSARMSSNSTLSIREAQDGNVLLYIKFTYTNKATTDFDWEQYSDWEFSMTYDNTYTYSVDVTSDVFPGYGLQPLMTGDFYVVFQVPEMLKFDGKAINVSFVVDDVHYSYCVRESSASTEMDTSLTANDKKVIDGKGEITFVKTSTTKKLLPPKASGWYTYYEAREGYTYVVAEFVVKNLRNESSSADDAITGSVLVDDQSIEGSCIFASSDKSDLGNYSFEVLAEHTAFFIAEVPDDKLNADISFSIIFCDEKFVVPFTNEG